MNLEKTEWELGIPDERLRQVADMLFSEPCGENNIEILKVNFRLSGPDYAADYLAAIQVPELTNRISLIEQLFKLDLTFIRSSSQGSPAGSRHYYERFPFGDGGFDTQTDTFTVPTRNKCTITVIRSGHTFYHHEPRLLKISLFWHPLSPPAPVKKKGNLLIRFLRRFKLR